MRLLVTTTKSASDDCLNRARTIATRLGAALEERRTVDLRAIDRETFIYVVGLHRDELVTRDDVLFIHPALLKRRRGEGREHPLMRALAPSHGSPIDRVIDATIGLALDALHIAEVLNVPVTGIEANSIVYSLLEEGLPRIAKGATPGREGAKRISLLHGDSGQCLASMATASSDCVYLDPPFPEPLSAISGFDLFRRIANPFDWGIIDEAFRVARKRVVIKVPAKLDPPLPTNVRRNHITRERGKKIDFVLIERSSVVN